MDTHCITLEQGAVYRDRKVHQRRAQRRKVYLDLTRHAATQDVLDGSRSKDAIARPAQA